MSRPPRRHGRMAATGTFVVGADVPGGSRPRGVTVRAACASPCARRACPPARGAPRTSRPTSRRIPFPSAVKPCPPLGVVAMSGRRQDVLYYPVSAGLTSAGACPCVVFTTGLRSGGSRKGRASRHCLTTRKESEKMKCAACPAWEGFTGGDWQEEIDPAEFIRLNYTPYDGDESFLANATEATTALWTKLQALQKEERGRATSTRISKRSWASRPTSRSSAPSCPTAASRWPRRR